MSAKAELTVAREAMLAVLDAKLADMPEWRAFRAIDRGIAALDGDVIKRAGATIPTLHPVYIRARSTPSYGDIAVEALRAVEYPMTTPEIIDKIEQSRGQKFDDTEKAKVNVTSSLSRDERVRNIPWKGGKAWWLSDQDVPSGLFDP